ncbi:MAG: translation initiation factor IF-2 [Candidatus Dadabacteria bacterium]|nr:translation initiation factor IF-2 [Candidatus Dadabacteria bacterium]MYA48264.1 translation initiation factor IF-2 [Candidatus Dadabacteria bacterium]MYG82236.1 translation initiation factor IF-2 [Candidatus Dadabacteria bacterium]MYK49841.1 translation initiation factor IF-2 [Candidatus Dadabacteria bacterium]
MPKVRIHQIAKELGVSSKEVIAQSAKLGMKVTSHQNVVSKIDADKIRKAFIPVPEDDSQKTVEEQKETVKVFKSETGDFVERRTGSRVIRRRKKVVKPEPEEVKEAAPAAAEPAEAVPELEIPAPPESAEAEAVEVPSAESEAAPEEALEAMPPPEAVVEAQEDDIELKPEPSPEPEKVVEETEEREAPKQQKKKARKTKVLKEEIHDEETLEQLKRAFRTKVPSRKEYVIQNKKPKLRQNFDGAGKNRGAYPADGQDARVIPVSPAHTSKRNIKLGETIVVSDLAKLMSVKASEVVKKLMIMGTGATINQSIDSDTAELVADEFGFNVTVERFIEEDLLFDQDESQDMEKVPRPPVVTVMGHVDHGKTTLLDSIRETDVVAGEAGGITQHIGAYAVNIKDSTIAFVDTPGHEAFTSMRARGASITDIVILVVAADDGVMPQTVEAVNHAKAAGVPIIVAINKVDKEGADVEKIRRELSEIGLISEQWGGDTLFAEVSAKKKKGISELLELVLLQADILELRASPDKKANGVVVEAELDKGKGAVSTVIVKEGTLRVGDCVVSGIHSGKIRALTDDKGKTVKSVGPSLPVKIMGLSGVAEAGEKFHVVKDEKTAKEITSHRQSKIRSHKVVATPKLSLEDLFNSIENEEAKELSLIIKADTQGSVEALRDSVEKLSTEKCRVKIVHSGAGGINETDVVLASASNAVVIGFNVRPDANALRISEKEGVSLELHSIIYDVVNRIKSAMEGLLEPLQKEVVVAHMDVKELFHVSRVGTIAGCMVSDGKVSRDNSIRVVRDGTIVYDGKVSSLRRFKEDVKEVLSGYECGITIENFNDVKQGDVFELYKLEEIKQEL